MGRRSNYDNRGFQQNQGRNTNQEEAQQQRVGGRDEGGWGTGFRKPAGGQRAGPPSNQNRFAAFDQGDQWNDRGQQSTRGGHRIAQQQQQQRQQQQQQQKGQRSIDWRAVVRDDMKNERPNWPFSSYGHKREAPSDLVGDFSYEEVRWAEMEAIRGGRPPAALLADFKVTMRSNEQQWQALTRASLPPSLGGPPAQPPVNSFAAPSPSQPATPIGQVVSAFGSFPGAGAMTPSPGFGSGFQRSPAEAMPSAGGAFGAAMSPFGGSSATGPAFRSPVQFPTPAGAGGASARGGSDFGTPLSPQQPMSLHQQQQPQPLPPNFAGAQIDVNGTDNNASPWLLPSFERGRIPETPPPPEVC